MNKKEIQTVEEFISEPITPDALVPLVPTFPASEPDPEPQGESK